MTPNFAQAVDPIFLYVLGLLERMNGDQTLVPQDERARIRGLIDQGQALVGASDEWELIKYALVSWIDEMLVETPWDGRDWWSNNVLEVELFNTRLCNEEFYARAREASTHARRDALEVFYVCVVLGFRGLYRDPAMAAVLTQSQELPPDLETWARQVVMSIRLGQGRPQLAGPAREIRGAPPQRVRSLVVWSWMGVGMLSLTLAVSYSLWFSKP